MEDPVRKVGAGGTAGGDRWEGEDEDEDVKVGAGRGCGLRRRGRELPTAGRAGGLWAQGRRPGPGWGASLGPDAALSPSARRLCGRDGQRGLSDFLGEAAAALPQLLVGPRPGLHPTRQLATGGDSSGGAAHVQTSWSGAPGRDEAGDVGTEPPGLSHMGHLATRPPVRAPVSPEPVIHSRPRRPSGRVGTIRQGNCCGLSQTFSRKRNRNSKAK